MLLDLLEMASNNALRHDEQSHQRLRKLQGKTMTLQVKPLRQTVTVAPQRHGLEFSGEPNANSDVTITATLGALVKLGRYGMDQAELNAGELEINGDAIVGQRFALVLAELDVDWEGLMAEHIGETPAVVLSTGLVKAREFSEESRLLFKRRAKKWLINDLQLVSDPCAVTQFLDDVDTLRADADRLQRRIERLRAKR